MSIEKDMSIDSDGTVVQTELDDDEYERFRRIADREGLSLKEALRRAATEFASSRERHDPDDPFFVGADDDVDTERELTARKTDEYLYE